MKLNKWLDYYLSPETMYTKTNFYKLVLNKLRSVSLVSYQEIWFDLI